MSEKLSIDQGAVHLLAGLLNQLGLHEIEYQQGDCRIRVAKPTETFASIASSVTPSSSTHVVMMDNLLTPAPVEPKNKITSPMVGTIYLAPEPGAPAFVRVGDNVQAGQTLLIIEAMKVMNPIRAPQAGTVTEICVTDASPVEFGEILLYLS